MNILEKQKKMKLDIIYKLFIDIKNIRSIAFILPNDRIKKELYEYVVSIEELEEYGSTVVIYEPWIDEKEGNDSLPYKFIGNPFKAAIQYDAIVIAVGHKQFRTITMADYERISKQEPVIVDVKGIVDNPTWKLV